MKRKNNEKDYLFSLKIVIFTVLFVIGAISFKTNSLYFFEDMQDYCYYCYDRTMYELKNHDDNYVFIRYGQDINIEEVQKNIEK